MRFTVMNNASVQSILRKEMMDRICALQYVPHKMRIHKGSVEHGVMQ